MAQKRIKTVQYDILNKQLQILYDDGTQGVLFTDGALVHSKAHISIQPNTLIGLTLKQVKMKLGIKN